MIMKPLCEELLRELSNPNFEVPKTKMYFKYLKTPIGTFHFGSTGYYVCARYVGSSELSLGSMTKDELNELYDKVSDIITPLTECHSKYISCLKSKITQTLSNLKD